MADLLRQIADFERARDELRDEIREAHSTLKALRHDVKEARKAEKDMERLVYETVAELIQANVSAAI